MQSFAYTNSAYAKDLNSNLSKFNANQFINIQDILIQNHGWTTNDLGPFGQTYKIAIDTVKMSSFLDLHPIVKNEYGGNKKTFVCDLFTKNRQIVLTNNHLIKTGYSQIKAKEIRNDYLISGKTLTIREWQLSDQYNWLSYINEATGSNKINQTIFNKPMHIKKCNSHKLTVDLDGVQLTFPNLILTIPNYVYLNKIKTTKGSKEINKTINQTAKNIAIGAVVLLKNHEWNKQDLLNFREKMFTGKVKYSNLLLASEFCKLSSKQKCAKFISFLYKSDNPDHYLDLFKKAILKKYKKS